MIGAFIFVVFFFLGLLLTISIPSLPPGPWIIDYLNIPYVEYEIAGLPLYILLISIVNGLIYGFIVWLAFSIINLIIKAKTSEKRRE